MKKLRKRFRKNIVILVHQELCKGTTVNDIALAITIATVIGIVPVPGISTITLLTIAIKLKLNILVVQTVNFVVYPLQFILFVPYIKMGQWFHSSNNTPESINDLLNIGTENWLITFKTIGVAWVWAVVSWMVSGLPLGFLFYKVLSFYLKKRFDSYSY